MNQTDRMNSASNRWEADPWDASDRVADEQLAGFQERMAKPIIWTSVRSDDPLSFKIDRQRLKELEVEFCAAHDGEEMLLMQLTWHGFPDPPEWRLATRLIGTETWVSWGYFAEIPSKWQLPDRSM